MKKRTFKIGQRVLAAHNGLFGSRTRVEGNIVKTGAEDVLIKVTATDNKFYELGTEHWFITNNVSELEEIK